MYVGELFNSMKSFNIVVLASCGGGNFIRLAEQSKEHGYIITKLICDRECEAVNKAKKVGIPYEIVNKKKHVKTFFDILDTKIPSNTDLIVLAGFMTILSPEFCKKWKRKIINTHPSLLPKYGGKGMYGVKVQEAVMKNKEKFAGCTVHFVDEKIDGGEIIFQKKVLVNYSETPWQLGGRIFNEEAPLLIKAIKKIMNTKCSVKVSICCITYNQAKYIKQCLDGFIMQKTNFPFEVLIHDDASVDGTKEIIEEYTRKYPDIIKPVYENENQYSKGVSISKTYNFPRVRGKYVVMCEGDDYWTDEYKLQKQVDFMEANPDYTICFHRVKRIFETGIKEDDIFPTQTMVDAGFTFENLLKCNFIQTNSVMYRWNAIDDVAAKFPSDILPGDWYLHLMFAKEGKIKFMEDIMSVYRVNANGVWYDSYKDKQAFYLKNCFKLMNFYKNVYKNLITNKNDKIYLEYIYKNFKIIRKKINESNCHNKKNMFLFKNFPIVLKVVKIYYNILK